MSPAAFNRGINSQPRLDRFSADSLARLGAAIRRARLDDGISQTALARRCGVNQTAISRLERGVAPQMAVVRFARVAAALPRLRLLIVDPSDVPVFYRVGTGPPSVMPPQAARAQGASPAGSTPPAYAWSRIEEEGPLLIRAPAARDADETRSSG